VNGAEAAESGPGAATTYVEPPRSYRSIPITVVLLAVAFALDVALGGGSEDIPGFLIVAVVVLGIHVLVIKAVRSTHSLRLTDKELRVGDEAVERSEIVGAVPGRDPELAVLGWPNGMPRGAQGVIVRLVDDQDFVVPTRNPIRLIESLGVDVPGPKAVDAIRPAEPDDLLLLPEIDDRADVVFRVAGYELPELPFDEGLTAAKAIFVLGRPPVAFVCVDEIDGLAHVEEIAVLPSSMRQGIGTKLLERACEWARAEGYPAIALTTYADVPWNGPYYASRGFAEATDVSPGLAQVREHERELGLDAVGRRIVMRRELSG
jgi:GNAT superfamily N-acetyltransferase